MQSIFLKLVNNACLDVAEYCRRTRRPPGKRRCGRRADVLGLCRFPYRLRFGLDKVNDKEQYKIANPN